jgi:hypothetical protein
MQGVEDGQRGKQGGGSGQKNNVHQSAVRVCIIVHVCLHLMNIVFRL